MGGGCSYKNTQYKPPGAHLGCLELKPMWGSTLGAASVSGAQCDSKRDKQVALGLETLGGARGTSGLQGNELCSALLVEESVLPL